MWCVYVQSVSFVNGRAHAHQHWTYTYIYIHRQWANLFVNFRKGSTEHYYIRYVSTLHPTKYVIIIQNNRITSIHPLLNEQCVVIVRIRRQRAPSSSLSINDHLETSGSKHKKENISKKHTQRIAHTYIHTEQFIYRLSLNRMPFDRFCTACTIKIRTLENGKKRKFSRQNHIYVMCCTLYSVYEMFTHSLTHTDTQTHTHFHLVNHSFVLCDTHIHHFAKIKKNPAAANHAAN